MPIAAHPRISVITPSYNQGHFLEQTIQSVLSQDYPNLEYIVVDGGSKDDSVEIINRYKGRLAWWVSEKDKGQTHAINKGLQHATGEILTYLNSDDLLLPRSLDRVCAYFSSHPDSDFLYGDASIVDAAGHEQLLCRTLPFNRHLVVYGRSIICQPASFFRRSLLDRIGLFDESLFFCMDIDFWVRAVLGGAKFQHVYECFAAARFHSNAKTMKHQRMLNEEHLGLLRRHGLITKARRIGELEFYCKKFVFKIIGKCMKMLLRRDFRLLGTARLRKRLRGGVPA